MLIYAVLSVGIYPREVYVSIGPWTGEGRRFAGNVFYALGSAIMEGVMSETSQAVVEDGVSKEELLKVVTLRAIEVTRLALTGESVVGGVVPHDDEPSSVVVEITDPSLVSGEVPVLSQEAEGPYEVIFGKEGEVPTAVQVREFLSKDSVFLAIPLVCAILIDWRVFAALRGLLGRVLNPNSKSYLKKFQVAHGPARQFIQDRFDLLGEILSKVFGKDPDKDFSGNEVFKEVERLASIGEFGWLAFILPSSLSSDSERRSRLMYLNKSSWSARAAREWARKLYDVSRGPGEVAVEDAPVVKGSGKPRVIGKKPQAVPAPKVKSGLRPGVLFQRTVESLLNPEGSSEVSGPFNPLEVDEIVSKSGKKVDWARFSSDHVSQIARSAMWKFAVCRREANSDDTLSVRVVIALGKTEDLLDGAVVEFREKIRREQEAVARRKQDPIFGACRKAPQPQKENKKPSDGGKKGGRRGRR